MNTTDVIIYQFCCHAWEQYRHEEKLPARGLPGLVPAAGDGGVLGGVRRLLKAVQLALAPQRPKASARLSGHVRDSVTA
jgi:hypothetical protein